MDAEKDRGPRLRRLAPGGLVLLAAVILLARHDVAPVTSLWYGVCLLWLVVIPGIVVARILQRRRNELLEELVVGSVVGLACLTLAWAACVGVGLPWLLWTYPVLVLLCAAVPPGRTRSALRLDRYDDTTTPATAWALTGLVLLPMVVLAATVFPTVPLPPAQGLWYPDLYWHLGLTNEALHSVPPRDPMLGDERLAYHWFANAHMATLSLTSGIDTLVVSTRLWIIPIEVLATGATFALGRRLGRRDATGLVAAGLLVVPLSAQPVTWLPLPAASAFIFASPSQVYALPFIVVGSWLLIELVQGRSAGRSWLLLALVLLGASGAKTSTLPVVLGGVGLGVVAVVRDRSARVRAAGAAALVAALVLVTAPFVADTSTGSTFRPGTYVARTPPWHDAALDPSGRYAPVALLALAVLWTLPCTPALLVAVAGRRDRGDAFARWFLLGAWVAALGAFFLVSHPSSSQLYFVRGALPLFACAAAWGLTSLLELAHAGLGPRAWVVTSMVGGAALASLAALRAAAGGSPPPVGSGPDRIPWLALAWLAAIALGVAIVALVRLLRSAALAAATAGGLAGAVLLGGSLVGADRLGSTLGAATRTGATPANQLSPDQIAGTTWLRDRGDDRTLLATNVHCLGGPTAAGCDTRAFWVAALSGHSTYVGGWAYTAGNQNSDSKALTYRRPFYDAERLRRNDGAFTDPTVEGLRALADHGVRWLFADRRAGPVSSRLDELAPALFRSGDITVHHLDPPPTDGPR